MNIYSFQYCQKIVLFNKEQNAVLLARRKGEADYDGVYSFVGGKMETTDGGLLQGLQREKDEEIGAEVKIKICPLVSYNAYFTKKDGSAMVLPHYYAIHESGDVVINEEYSDFKWVLLTELAAFGPKIENIDEVVAWVLKMRGIIQDSDFVTI